ncbi:hypothetical protein [Streptomyces sp. AP-93]|uniref:hypothetical protein n=1 Tax=Streptomyces sp. AP-93 TaxID=2929048 RepID=UPI001FB01365|nr:hypothetical protein [Streptomyces sp. AP-93]MCJ0869737.1 hypothetical protein [Streptomyces sp. AP-93]
MKIPSDTGGGPTEAALTTEDLAHPGTGDEEAAPVYPGEATQDREVRQDPEAREDPVAGEDREGYEDDMAAEEDRTVAPTGADAPEEAPEGVSEPLLGTSDTEEFRQSWTDIQGRFVDDPQGAVRSADALVAEVMQTLAGSFAAHKQELEAQWGRGEEVETEDLRQALRHYRSFFNRLLKT